MTTLTVDDGSSVQLGAVLAKAGEGTIHEVIGRPDLVAKIFHRTLAGRAEKLDKVAAMVDSPPSGAVQPDGFVVLTWPRHLVFESGVPVGYLMPRVDTTKAVELHAVSNPFNRANPLKNAPRWTVDGTWSHLVDVAANLCLAVDVVHRVHAVIGDFQERNVLVSDTSRVTLVDCDSMQFIDASGRQFLCGVARPEFAAPELAAINLRSDPRDTSSDLFALAVHIYQLLMGGNHPFMRGVWMGLGEQPTALRLAEMGWWAGGPASKLAAHPLAPQVSFLTADLMSLFEGAFTYGARDPARRPSAAEWRRALLAVRTTSCSSGTHHIPVGTWRCPWCAIDTERGHRRQQAASLRANSPNFQAISSVAHLTPVIPWPDTAAAPAITPDWRHNAGSAPSAPAAVGPGPRTRIPLALLAVGTVLIAVTATVIGVLATREGHQNPDTGNGAAALSPQFSTGSPTATAQAINNAQVGDCLHRESGPIKDGGGFDMTVWIVTCDSKDATDRVNLRSNDTSNCGNDAWARTDEYVPPIVLCLDKK